MRRGFTLIEMLIVMVIIGLLMAILLPAVQSVQRRAKAAQIRVEISAIEAAAVAFKNEYGSFPPSRIRLYESGSGDPSWSQHGASGSDDDIERTRSIAIIRQLWPQFDFSMTRNFDGDGDDTEYHDLNGSQCLVLLLGGLRKDDEDANCNGILDGGEDVNDNGILDRGAYWGLSKNPANPFGSIPSDNLAYYRWDMSRTHTVADHYANDCFFTAADAIGTPQPPYVFASSYDGSGYDSYDVTYCGMTDVYMQTGTSPHNASTFQIISPGFDGLYGNGGPPESHSLDDEDNIANASIVGN